jgi:CRISPR-associated endonuclease/helicase Cas3
MSFETIYAHTPPKKHPDRWHSLSDHLRDTANAAAQNAESFGSPNAAFVLGLFHDLGKIHPDFQEYLRACSRDEKHEQVPHAIAGAALLWRMLLRANLQSESLAMCALGHHTGLGAEHETLTSGGKLDQWLQNPSNRGLQLSMQKLLKDLPVKTPEPLPPDELRREFRIRMLFSSLVDADFLDTEKHFDPDRSSFRPQRVRMEDLWSMFRRNQIQLMGRDRHNAINRVRNEIYFSCVEAGKQSPGVFRLTVPTGGGKTRSVIAFALSHAVANTAHGFRRVIVALPYTSIIDQNARVYREVFGDDLVLEHHSQIEIPDTQQQDEAFLRQRLAAENWDYPIVVTTTVQLLESLFSNKTGKCRKLHNIARSVLILDEVQTLPPELLSPTMDVLRTLVDEYGATLVLSTATQPAFDQTEYLKAFNGLTIKEIVPDYRIHFKQLERVEYEPIREYNSLSKLSDEIKESKADQVLVILNTRKHALKLFERLKSQRVEGLYHMSTLLCGAHRKRILKEITDRLNSDNPLPVRLISTQVVEAGVDLDFPIVYRVIGPLDRIVQAAGRCNREGRREKGKVVIFNFPENTAPLGAYKIGMADAKVLLDRIDPQRLHDPELYTEYFQMLFRDVDLDKKGIQPYRRDLDYPNVAEKYKLIEDTVPVVVTTYDNNEGQRRLDRYLANPSRESFRRLTPYIVNVRHYDLRKDEYQGCFEQVNTGLYKWLGAYDDRGITDILFDPADLVI